MNMIIRFLKKIFYKLPYGIQAWISKVYWKPKFGDKVFFGYGTKTYYGKVEFGRGTRVAGNSIYSNLIVGNYTVFAEGFRCLAFVHDYSCFSVNSELPNIVGIKHFEEIKDVPQIKSYPLTNIGSDVWIGENVTVKGGVTIGDGAVIAARSVVTHDVEPFSIVAGVPAKFVKWRFDEKKIKLMKKIEWWNWPEEKIIEQFEKLCSFDEDLGRE